MDLEKLNIGLDNININSATAEKYMIIKYYSEIDGGWFQVIGFLLLIFLFLVTGAIIFTSITAVAEGELNENEKNYLKEVIMPIIKKTMFPMLFIALTFIAIGACKSYYGYYKFNSIAQQILMNHEGKK